MLSILRPVNTQKPRKHTTSAGPCRPGIYSRMLTAQIAIGQVRVLHATRAAGDMWLNKGSQGWAAATGYYTTRPSTKLYSRVASHHLRAARQLEVVLGTLPEGPTTQQLARTAALMQHHDAITGTDRFHVNQDYRKLIAGGIREGQQIISQQLGRLLLSGANQDLDSPSLEARRGHAH